jgi:hypothetical protein
VVRAKLGWDRDAVPCSAGGNRQRSESESGPKWRLVGVGVVTGCDGLDGGDKIGDCSRRSGGRLMWNRVSLTVVDKTSRC